MWHRCGHVTVWRECLAEASWLAEGRWHGVSAFCWASDGFSAAAEEPCEELLRRSGAEQDGAATLAGPPGTGP